MDSFNEVLDELVKVLGGAKDVGCLLWPEMDAQAAQRKLLDCLNPERSARLTPEQAVFLMRKARQAGCHAGAEWLMAHLGYAAPVPLEPQDEIARLQREFITATQGLQAMVDRMQTLQAQQAAGQRTLRAAA